MSDLWQSKSYRKLRIAKEQNETDNFFKRGERCQKITNNCRDLEAGIYNKNPMEMGGLDD